MYIKHIFLLLFCVCYCLIIGCSRTDYDNSNYYDYILENEGRIKLGMEKNEVIEILGLPSASFFEKEINQENFFYNIPSRHLTDELNNRPTNFFIIIQSNKVVHAGMMWKK